MLHFGGWRLNAPSVMHENVKFTTADDEKFEMHNQRTPNILNPDVRPFTIERKK
jgi:hypothetical protein